MRKQYQTAELYIVRVLGEDVITTSEVWDDNPYVSDFYEGDGGDSDYE